MTDRVELFIEGGCSTCEKVLVRLLTYTRCRGVELTVYDREVHQRQFELRRVVICPATLVNDRLVSYGDCSPDLLEAHLSRFNPEDDSRGSGTADQEI
jgi:hypothetical protein